MRLDLSFSCLLNYILTGGALIKVPDSAGSTVHYNKRQVLLNCVCH